MFQFNAQHTGFNDASHIQPPLGVEWMIRYWYDSPASQISVAGDRLFVTTIYGGVWPSQSFRDALLYCINVRDATPVWRDTLIDLVWTDQIAIGDSLIYCQIGNGDNSYLQAYSLDGEKRWSARYSMQSQQFLCPTIYGSRIYINGGHYTGMYSFDAASGYKYWFTRIGDVAYQTPAVYGSTVYTFSAMTSWAIFFGWSADDGTEAWRLNLPVIDTIGLLKNVGTSPVIDTLSQIAYAVSEKALYAIDLTTRSLKWWVRGSYQFGLERMNPALCNGVVYAIESGGLAAYDGQTGTELWRFDPAYKVNDPLQFPPVVANGHVYVSANREMYAVNIESHEVVWSLNWIGGRMSIAGNRLLLGTRDGQLVSFTGLATDVPDTADVVHSDELLLNARPNPFNSVAEISYVLPRSGNVRLEIVNLLGQTVTILAEGFQSSGEHRAFWSGTTSTGQAVGSGIYYCVMRLDGVSTVRKLVLLK